MTWTQLLPSRPTVPTAIVPVIDVSAPDPPNAMELTDEMLKAIKAVWGRAEDAVSEEEIVKRIRTLLKRHSGGLSALYATHANTARHATSRCPARKSRWRASS